MGNSNRVWYNENDPKAATWLRELIKAELIPAGDVDERSITEVNSDEIREYDQCHFFAGIGGWPLALQLAGWPADRPVWSGSCPCQSLSVAGLGRGADDERHLWPEFARLISGCSPPLVFGEQVSSKLGRTWLAGVFADLEEMGYFTDAADLCAASVNAPHIRQRLWWVADSENGDRRRGERGTEKGTWEAEIGGRRSGISRTVGRLADSECQQEQQEQQEPNETERERGSDSTGRRGMVGSRMGNAISSGLQGHTGHEPDRHEPGRIDTNQDRPATEAGGDSGKYPEWIDAGPLDGPIAWDGSIWIPCADGKARRIEPGTSALALGLPRGMVPSGDPSAQEARNTGEARTMRLRGYGNSIAPEVARVFIQSYMETED